MRAIQPPGPLVALATFLLASCQHESAAEDVISTETGIASHYSAHLDGGPTASGEVYDHDAMTAAHRTLPFDTRVRVVNLRNENSVILRINDRGPFIEGRIIDVSGKAAEKLRMKGLGLVKVRVEVLRDPKDDEEEEAEAGAASSEDSTE